MKFLSDIRSLLLGVWLGAAVFFILVAQSIFATVPTREMGGTLVTRILAILNYAGLGISIVLLLTSLISAEGKKKAVLWIERVLLLVTGAACAVSQFVFSWWLLMLRTQMGRPIDEVPADDPLRIQFNNLHEYSSWALIVAMFAGAIAFFLIRAHSNKPDKKTGFTDFDFQKQISF
jgi:hypothetical protein